MPPEPPIVSPSHSNISPRSSTLPSHIPGYPGPFTGLTSLQIRQEKEAELRANDLHWQKRINQLEETHQKINDIMESEYKAAVCKLIDSYYLIMYYYVNCM